MSDYTPTTEEVQRAYRNSEYGGPDTEFDRWLAQAKAQAWEEGYVQGSSDNYGSSSDVQYADNPYK